jgi:hypothetical protein
MPLPKKHKEEKRSEFMQRCMANHNVQNDFETQDQKIAVCESLFKKKSKKASFAIVTESDQTNYYTITPEDEEKNPLDHPSDTEKKPDKWPTQAPVALDDANNVKPDFKATKYPYGSKCPICGLPTITNIRQLKDDPEAHSCVNGHKYSRAQSIKADLPSLPGPGINPNPDNSKNFPIKSGGNWEKPTLKDQKWFLAIEEAIPDDNIENMKEWYISSIDDMPELEGQWPLSFDKIEKDFDRPNKINTPEVKLKTKQSEENRDPIKLEKDNKQFVI